MDCVLSAFNNENQAELKAPDTAIFTRHIVEKIGLFETIQNLIEIENLSTSNDNITHKTETLFQIFLEKIVREELISKEEISEYVLNNSKMKDGAKSKQIDSKEASYTFNPCKFQSVEKQILSAKSYGKDFGSNSPYNSIDLRDDNLTKKQYERISMGENFLENDFFSLGDQGLLKKRQNSNPPSNTHTSVYSDMVIDLSSDNNNKSSNDFDETEIMERQAKAKKTVY